MEQEFIKGYTISHDGICSNTKGKILKTFNRKGYESITIRNKKYYIHRLVAMAFIPNPDNKPEIDHIDGNPLNNHVDNLRWVTRQENELNPITRKRISTSLKGRIITKEWRNKITKSLIGKKQTDETKKKRADKLRGKKRPVELMQKLAEFNKKPIICIVNKTGEMIMFNSQKEAAQTLGISESAICNNILGKKKSRYYTWIRN